MTEKLRDKIEEEIAKLPKETQEAIKSVDWVKTSEEIGHNYFLDEDEINDLQVEILLILTGLEEGYVFSKNIEVEVGLEEEDAKAISDEVNKKIFTPIYNILESNVKNNIKNINPNWQQNLNFILSGGNYSALAGARHDIIETK